MARDYIDIVYVEANGQELDDVTSVEVSDTRPNAEALHTMNRRRKALGYKKGNRAIEVNIETRIRNPREFDWHALYRAGTLFPVAYEESASGTKWVLQDLLITEITPSHNSDGESMERIRCLALDHYPEA